MPACLLLVCMALLMMHAAVFVAGAAACDELASYQPRWGGQDCQC